MKKSITIAFTLCILLVSCGKRPVILSPTTVPTQLPTMAPTSTSTPTSAPVATLTDAGQIVCEDKGQVTVEENVGWLDDYLGSLNNEPSNVGMLLQYSGNSIAGDFFYTHQPIEMTIKGCLEEGRSLILYLFNDQDENVAVIHASFPEFDSLGGKLEREGIIGTYTNQLTQEESPIEVYMDYAKTGILENEYQDAGVTDDDMIEHAAQSFLQAVATDDKETVANLVAYPITVMVGENSLEINNAQQLINNYNRIFTEKFKAYLATAVPKHMFSKYTGIMLLSGEIWFDADGKVIDIRNYQ